MGDEILCVCLVPRECDPLKYDEGARDERKVFWHSERELEEDLIELARDGGELRTALRGPLPDGGPLTDCCHLSAPPLATTPCEATLRELGRCGDPPLLEDGAERRHERAHVNIIRQEAQCDAILDERRHVAAHQVHDRRGEATRIELGDLGAEPKVDEDETSLAIDEQIPRVRVRVEEANLEQLDEEAVDADGGEASDDF